MFLKVSLTFDRIQQTFLPWHYHVPCSLTGSYSAVLLETSFSVLGVFHYSKWASQMSLCLVANMWIVCQWYQNLFQNSALVMWIHLLISDIKRDAGWGLYLSSTKMRLKNNLRSPPSAVHWCNKRWQFLGSLRAASDDIIKDCNFGGPWELQVMIPPPQ